MKNKNFKIDLIAGTRPNFIKIAPLYKTFKKASDIKARLVHTGQHYDKEMSQIFFEELNIPKPDINLEVGSDTHSKQTAKIMVEYEKLIENDKPDMVLVVGDVNSTAAAAITAKKLNTLLGHIEAGLRSFDRTMPEEINRIITDSISDHLFTTSQNANDHLSNEGHEPESIHFVGNIMIDSLNSFKNKTKEKSILKSLKIKPKEYILVTLHRPSNVDTPKIFKKLTTTLDSISKKTPVIFPAHPRTKEKINNLKLSKNFHITEPLGYLEFLGLQKQAKAVITDSGGIQEETTVLQTPCITLRENTERPITITEGSNTLIKPSDKNLKKKIKRAIKDQKKINKVPEYWDGKTAQRILKIIQKIKNNN